MKAPERYYDFQKDISGCGVFGVIDTKRGLIPGSTPIEGMACMHDRGNGLGGGFAAYGIYPEHKDQYALHLMCDNEAALANAREVVELYFEVSHDEPIPTRKTLAIKNPPLVWRFFVLPKAVCPQDCQGLPEEDFVVALVMKINTTVPG
ncbi:MAG: hypothetical protein V3573_10445, partial [Desulfovibrionaceae bacterium]